MKIDESECTDGDKGKTWPQYLAVLTALFAMFNSGLHFGWPSPSIPKILSNEYPINVTAEEASYITIIGPVGGIGGSILYPCLVDIIGRKFTILLIAVPQIISMLMIYFSWYTKILLYAARFIGGLSEAACFTILPLYIGEVAEPKVRGILGSYFSLVLILGILTVNIVGSYTTIHTAALIFAILPIIFLVCFSQMPESPYYLIMKTKSAEAETVLKKLRRKANVQAELRSLTEDVNRQISEPGRYKDLFLIKSNRVACVVMCGLRVIQQFSGVSAFTVYMQLLFKKSTNVMPEDIASISMFCLQLLVNFIATFIVDRVGRKPLLIFSCAGCSFVLFLDAIYFALLDYTSVDLSYFTYLPLICIILFIICFAIGLGNVVNLMLGEMFSSSIKAKASCLMNLLFAITMTLSTKFYQYTADSFSLSVPFFVFGFCQLLGTLFCVFWVPETTGKTLEQIQQELKGRKRNVETNAKVAT